MTQSDAVAKGSPGSGRRDDTRGYAAALAALESEVGSVIAGRFTIEQVLGRGATGAVFQVRDASSGARLALKRLSVADAREHRRMVPLFEREFHTLAQLAHPRIIAVHDYGVDERGAYYTMELLDGVDLRERGKLSWQEACPLLRDVASSLAILHSRKLLHRDLSPRNVRCTSDGRAKLIDFGVMIPMSVPRTIAGTPPFVPPEATQQQTLDARADLYSLGALSYWVLTARHAYPAHTFAELPQVWRSRPPSPRELEPSIPLALSELVMQLLHGDRMARPSSAAEVTERLCTIAALPMDERPEVGAAYLTTPVLVGREQAMGKLRTALVEASLGRASSVVIAGGPGSGRSRFLDGCVLEGKLLGATVLRADGGDGARSSYTAIGELIAQLLGAMPQQALELAGPWRPLLAQVIDGLEMPDAEAEMPRPPPERARVQSALCDFLLAASRARRLLIAVDDFESIDEASAAVLTAIAHKSDRRRPMLVVTAFEHAGSQALRVLCEVAREVALPPLSLEQTEALMRSMFGDVSNVVKLAHRVHDLCQGNPRDAVELVRNLVERGVARYQAGSWLLPHALSASDLPATLTEGRAARFAALGADAREFAGALSLVEPRLLALADYPLLVRDWGHARIYRALDELVAAGVLRVAGDRYDFTQLEFASIAGAALAPEGKRALHLSLAASPVACTNEFVRARHLLEAGEVRAATELLSNVAYDPNARYSLAMLDLLDRAMATTAFDEMSPLLRSELEVTVVGISALLGDYARFSRCAFPLLERARKASGLDDWHALDAAMPAQERLTAALTRAQQRFTDAPEAQRGLAPVEAIRILARTCSAFCGMTTNMQEPRLVLDLPSLAPFVPLSPALFAVDRLIETLKHFMTARFDRAREIALELIERLEQPDGAGLEPVYLQAIRLGVRHMVAVIEVGRGMAVGSARIAELERVPGLRSNAWRIRRIACLMEGDFEAAQQCQRRAELLELQDGQSHTYPATVARVEVIAHTMAEDLIGLKQATDRMAELAAGAPGWRNSLRLARASYKLLQGDGEGALSELAPALAETAPGADMDWPWVATTHIAALHAAGRADDAVRIGLEYYATCLEKQLVPSHRNVARPLCDALAAVGRTDEALALIDACLKEAEEAGSKGLALGMFYEVRARLALAVGDDAGFRTFAARCAKEYQGGNNVGLTAKYERLLQQARRSGIELGTLPHAAPPLRGAGQVESAFRTVQSRLSACTGDEERARCAITLLLQSTGAESGRLYALRAGALKCLAAQPESAEPPDVLPALERFLERELQRPQATLAMSPGASRQTSELGASLPPELARAQLSALTLSASRDGELIVVGVAVIGPAPQGRTIALEEVLHAVALSLLEREDVDPLTCVG